MSEIWANYQAVILVALVVGLIVGLLVFRPRQRVALTQDETPVRPHMMAPSSGGEGKGVADEAAAAASDVAGQILGAEVHANLPGATGTPDDLRLLKGVGPKFATLLNEMGLTRYDQLAKLSPSQVEAIDAKAGAFKGRFDRDRIVEQADYLARGDTHGYESRFGKL